MHDKAVFIMQATSKRPAGARLLPRLCNIV